MGLDKSSVKLDNECAGNYDESAMTIKRITIPIFLVATIAVLLLSYTGNLPDDMMGAFAIMLVLGLLLGTIGDNIPIFKDWFGGGPILCIFVPAFMDYWGWLPSELGLIMKNFQATNSFFAFFISALICGAIFSLSRQIILKASIRFIPAVIGGIVVSFIFAAIGGVITGYGAKEALFYLAVPIMGGGIGAGALPLAGIYSQAFGVDAGLILSNIMPAVVYGNVIAIFFGIILNQIGRLKPSWTGNGNLMKVMDPELEADIVKERDEVEANHYTCGSLGTGFFITLTYYMVALAIGTFIFPNIHPFVWLVLLLTASKALQLIPRRLEIDTIQWSNLWVKNLIYAVLIPIGPAYMDLETTIAAVSNPAYLVIGFLTILGVAIGAGLFGKAVGLYPIDSSIAGGLCMANMAQTGDLAVLSGADRMELLPFSAYSSRIGGSIILILAGLLSIFIKI